MKSYVKGRGPQQGYTRHNEPSPQFYKMNNPYLNDFDFLHYNDPRLYYHPEDEPVRWSRYQRRHDPDMSPDRRHSHRLRGQGIRPTINAYNRWPEDPRNREARYSRNRHFPEYREPYSPRYRNDGRQERDARFYGAMEPEERRLWQTIDNDYTDH